MIATEAISSRVMPRDDDPAVFVLAVANEKLRLNVAGVKGIVLTVGSISGSPVIGDTLQVRYNLTNGKTVNFDVDHGAVITGNSLPVERSFSDTNGMPLDIQWVEVELTALSSASTFAVYINGTKRPGVG